jgi:hypothetical protein
VAARIPTSFSDAGLLSEPGEPLRWWLLLGGWAGPSTAAPGARLGAGVPAAFTFRAVPVLLGPRAYQKLWQVQRISTVPWVVQVSPSKPKWRSVTVSWPMLARQLTPECCDLG